MKKYDDIIMKKYVENMKEYVENVKEYVKNTKKYVENMKEYVDILDLALHIYMDVGTWKTSTPELPSELWDFFKLCLYTGSDTLWDLEKF